MVPAPPLWGLRGPRRGRLAKGVRVSVMIRRGGELLLERLLVVISVRVFLTSGVVSFRLRLGSVFRNKASKTSRTCVVTPPMVDWLVSWRRNQSS